MLSTSDKQSLSIDLNLNPLHTNVGTSPKEDSRFDFLYQRTSPIPQEPEQIVEVINRMSIENKKLTEMLIVVCDNYKALQTHVQQLMMQNKSGKEVSNNSKKRKAEADNLYSPDALNCSENNCRDHAGSSKISKEVAVINISRAYVRTDPCDKSLIVKDGYTWRKYGQKVTRDNPSPRAYYKCSFAPGCQVKKKVQRSNEDASVLVAIYEGKHNHKNPRGQVSLAMAEGALPTILTPDVFEPGFGRMTEELFRPDTTRESTLEEFLAEHMATSLTRNRSFTAALAAAISTKIFEE